MLKEGFELSQTGGTLELDLVRLGFTQMKPYDALRNLQSVVEAPVLFR